MKLEILVDRNGIPLAAATDAANVSETILAEAAETSLPNSAPGGSKLIADLGYDSDQFRDEMESRGYHVIVPHRRNRKKASRNDGRSMRRYRRRYIVERTMAWIHSFRRLMTRYEYKVHLYDGFVALAMAFIALSKL
jgi:transposase